MPTIEIDDDIYAVLQHHGRPFVDTPNDVLRRLLLDADASALSPPAPSTDGRPGDLLPLLVAGLLQAGDELVYEQPRKGRVHHGKVTANGGIEVNDRVFTKVSPSL